MSPVPITLEQLHRLLSRPKHRTTEIMGTTMAREAAVLGVGTHHDRIHHSEVRRKAQGHRVAGTEAGCFQSGCFWIPRSDEISGACSRF